MTLAEYIQAIREAVRETTPAFFTNDEIMNLINLKEIEFVRKTKWLTAEGALSWESDGYSVLLPADFMSVDFVLLTDENGFTNYLEKRGGKGRATSSELDMGYRLDATKLWLTNTTVNDSETVLTLSYVYFPSAFTDSTADLLVESDLGDDFAEAIIDGAVSRMLVKQERFKSAQYHEAAYQGSIREATKFRNARIGKNVTNIDH